jgi:uncharacterized protein (TIRG00374 family)
MKKYLPLIGIALFLYIISRFDLSQIYTTLQAADQFYLILAFLLIPVLIFLRGLKWKVILNFCEIDYPLKDVTAIWLIGLFTGTITPGRIGEFSRAYYIKKEGFPTGSTVLSVVLDRIVELIVLSIFCIFGVFFLLFYVGLNLTFLFAVLLCVFLAIYAFSEKSFVSSLSRPIFDRFVPKDKKHKIRITFDSFYERFDIIKSNKNWSFQIFLISFITQSLHILQFYTLALALGIKVNIFYLGSVFPLVAIATTLPISISGLGTREVTYLYFFTKIGIPPVQAISLSLLALMFNWIPTILGLILWIIYSRRS